MSGDEGAGAPPAPPAPPVINQIVMDAATLAQLINQTNANAETVARAVTRGLGTYREKLEMAPFDGKYPGLLGSYLDEVSDNGLALNMTDDQIIRKLPALLDADSLKAMKRIPAGSKGTWRDLRTALINEMNPPVMIADKRDALIEMEMIISEAVPNQSQLNAWKDEVRGRVAATLPHRTIATIEAEAARIFVKGLPAAIAHQVRTQRHEDTWRNSIETAERICTSARIALKQQNNATEKLNVINWDPSISMRKANHDQDSLAKKVDSLSEAVEKLTVLQTISL